MAATSYQLSAIRFQLVRDEAEGCGAARFVEFENVAG
jgi:hypothetical protein